MLLQVFAGIASRSSMDTGGREWPAVSYGFRSSGPEIYSDRNAEEAPPCGLNEAGLTRLTAWISCTQTVVTC